MSKEYKAKTGKPKVDTVDEAFLEGEVDLRELVVAVRAFHAHYDNSAGMPALLVVSVPEQESARRTRARPDVDRGSTRDESK